MKYFLVFIFINKVLLFPIINERIVYPDEFKELQSVESTGYQMSLLNDPNILQSDNMTAEFLIYQDGFKNLEDGEYFQGDMVMNEEQLNTINDTSDLSLRTGIINERFRWPKDVHGDVIVPFKISSDFDWIDRARIKLAMYDIEKYSCIVFKQQTDQQNFINITSNIGCYSHVGKINGGQKLSLKIGGCLTRGTIIHELMHALGFDHMQNHADRDDFIEILWENIKPGSEPNFEKVNSRLFGNFGTPYDYHSVMHYGLNYFSKNENPTIVSKSTSHNKVIGNRLAMSLGDAQRLNAMYKCTKKNVHLPVAVASAIWRVFDSH
ncbi:unnamed protein product [Chironomus riparius]|uniref:Metalloendopeptidase n=1 Tax=Chironomus riparius TaxID=315576 RepID=A0A9N9S1H2_9DIPT|nr:unnamed protein product [Chironomus riparius]